MKLISIHSVQPTLLTEHQVTGIITLHARAAITFTEMTCAVMHFRLYLYLQMSKAIDPWKRQSMRKSSRARGNEIIPNPWLSDV